MNVKNTTLSLFLLLSVHLFSQEVVENKNFVKVEPKLSYLDSIKKTFVKDEMASCVDSLWMKELTNLDLYNNITDDIKNINIDEKVDYELPTELLKERLAAMDAKSPFNIEYNQGLENIIKSFLKNRKRSFERLMAISEYYFPLFEEALAKQNVPLEIKYLAVVESALNPKAVSKMGATGLWQFMYQTGKQYGLKIDSYVDERSDPLKASEAATQYMTNMYKIFGDWDLVLASYNSGPGNVSKAIRRSGGQQNYWNIRKNLPKETQGYVPAFLATMYIYEYHKEHGIIPNRATVKHFATDTIMIKKQMSFKQISDLLDVPVAQLQLLNPSYKLNVVPVYHDENHFLRLPQDKVAVFTSNEAKIYAYTQHELDFREKPFQVTKAIVVRDTTNYTTQRITLPKTKYYKVKRGDNLSEIANKYDVAVSDIKKWNKLKSNAVPYGKSLKIITEQSIVRTIKKEPKVEAVPSETVSESQRVVASEVKINKEEELASNPERKDIEYVVQKGDNLGNIAHKFGTTLADLKQWNNLSDHNIALGATLIVAKDEIVITTDKATADSFKKKANLATGIEYYVKKGDSLFSIAKKYPGVTISDIKKWNDIRGGNIKPGMKLKING
ncbi:LysM peptidoglycan-binding domain-containing protein [Flavobacterium gawalongense]|uniref:LysM peptidoglycan-binding domain-containing protein n=1 Tax=Flavobacterium gawalongense TaxID=2594432 RepID=A0ABY3CNC3_9FLAO|nr:LysM peptidoglycan-binding domain-containing protein [Flavobacterium gawalongense]TRX01673.1 LysM peptidoglycan-binding domain-containing protein [Flavobacterium gawalongense]TRX08439.1 LysM peptidoglycan-binding domain-containing protein [Flavobacterium gawalongense]